jgi:hypothetical protein
MLAELAERDATGGIARIYEEIRRCCAVPYVSSMQRHLATRPGWLEWVWASLRPAFSSGRAQTVAWRVSEKLEVPALAPISREALAVWGVDAPALTSIAAACDSFVRVSPVNLVLAGLLRRLLRGERPNGADVAGDGDTGWAPPPPLPALPGMVDAAALPPAERAVLASLGTTVDGEPFVPGLYRMLARWPGLLAHLATVLGPYLDDAAMLATQARLAEAIDAEVPAVFAALPALRPQPPEPDPAAIPAVVAALDTYRVTSPQLCVLGRMVRGALPDGQLTSG